MGQYHRIINLDKKEFLYPHRFDDGIKLLEFGSSGNGTMLALAILLANSPNRGGGDLRSDDTQYYGRWAGDRIIIAGDYAEPGDKGEADVSTPIAGYVTLYQQSNEDPTFTDISENVIKIILDAGAPIRHD